MVYLLFFLSGAAALVYEIAWSRQLGLLFGHTVHAAAIVLGAYFAGMALGNWLAGALARRIHRPLAGYGIAEIIVAGWAWLTPAIIGALDHPLYRDIINHPNPAHQLAWRALAAFLVLLPATIALGMTLPLIAQHVSPPGRPQPRRIALAYALNTAGAVTGVVLATYVLILALGVHGSGNLAATVSALCGMAALVLARGRRSIPAVAIPTPQPKAPTPASTGAETIHWPLPTWAWYVLAGLSGFATLAAQVFYIRLAALIAQNSTYTFGTVVAVFLAALALGSWLAARLTHRLGPARLTALALAAGAVLVPLGIYAFQRATGLESAATGLPYWGYLARLAGLCALAAFPAVTALGIVLPAAFTAVRDAGTGPGGRIGGLAAVNTVCAAAGSLAASFLLLPTLGLWGGFALITAVYLIAAALLAFRGYGLERTLLPGLVLLATAVFATVAAWQPLAHCGPGERIVWERETPYGVLAVIETATGDLALTQNNSYRLGATFNSGIERQQAWLPLLLHGNPRENCFLGLATGITAGTALKVWKHVTAVELVPEVVEAARLFDGHNGGIVQRGEGRIVINDARHYLQSTDARYDVIVSDLFVPWHSQTGYLYTVEHYRAARERLSDGGLFCQWLALYEVSPRELCTIAASMAEAFPVVTLWRADTSSPYPLVALVGTEEPLQLDGTRLNQWWAGYCTEEPAPLIDRGVDVLRLYIGRWPAPGETVAGAATLDGVDIFAPGAVQLNTDDHPVVEFLAPLSDGRHDKLVGDRLREFYDEVLLRLPTDGIVYTPQRGEPPPDLAAGREEQRENIPNAQQGGRRRLY